MCSLSSLYLKSSSPLLGARYLFNTESDMFSDELRCLESAGPAVSILCESLQLLRSISCFV